MAVVTAGWPTDLMTLNAWDRMDVDEAHRVECNEGILVVTPKPLPMHQRIAARLAVLFDAQLPANLTALADVEVLLTEVPLTVRAPDVLVTGADVVAANPARLSAAEVLAAVEILSDGSRRTDLVTKMSEYAEAGIPDYLIIDAGEQVVLLWHRLDLSTGRYSEPERFTEEVGSDLAGGGRIKIDPAALAAR